MRKQNLKLIEEMRSSLSYLSLILTFLGLFFIPSFEGRTETSASSDPGLSKHSDHSVQSSRTHLSPPISGSRSPPSSPSGRKISSTSPFFDKVKAYEGIYELESSPRGSVNCQQMESKMVQIHMEPYRRMEEEFKKYESYTPPVECFENVSRLCPSGGVVDIDPSMDKLDIGHISESGSEQPQPFRFYLHREPTVQVNIRRKANCEEIKSSCENAKANCRGNKVNCGEVRAINCDKVKADCEAVKATCEATSVTDILSSNSSKDVLGFFYQSEEVCRDKKKKDVALMYEEITFEFKTHNGVQEIQIDRRLADYDHERLEKGTSLVRCLLKKKSNGSSGAP